MKSPRFKQRAVIAVAENRFHGGGNNAPEWVATIVPELVATIIPEWVATIARIPQLEGLIPGI